MLGLERRPHRPSTPPPPAARKALIAAMGGTVASKTKPRNNAASRPGRTRMTAMPLDLARAIALNLRLRQR
jgi:hypothetical protein